MYEPIQDRMSVCCNLVDFPPACRLGREGAIETTRRLAEMVARLHALGRFHGEIAPETIVWDGDRPALLPAGRFCLIGPDARTLECVPLEMHSIVPLRLPTRIDAARRGLMRRHVGIPPRQIDIYALGAIFCRLLIGESALAYLRSPRVAACVPDSCRRLLDRALAAHPADQFPRIREFIRLLD